MPINWAFIDANIIRQLVVPFYCEFCMSLCIWSALQPRYPLEESFYASGYECEFWPLLKLAGMRCSYQPHLS